MADAGGSGEGTSAGHVKSPTANPPAMEADGESRAQPHEQIAPQEPVISDKTSSAGNLTLPTVQPAAIQPSSSTAPPPSAPSDQPPPTPAQETDFPDDPYVKRPQAIPLSRPEAIQPTAPQRTIIIANRPPAQPQKPIPIRQATAPRQSPVIVRQATAQPQKPIAVLKRTAQTGSPIIVRKPTAPPQMAIPTGQATAPSRNIIAVNHPIAPKSITVQQSPAQKRIKNQPTAPVQKITVVNSVPTRQIIVAKRSASVQKPNSPTPIHITAQQPSAPARQIVAVMQTGVMQKPAAPTPITVQPSTETAQMPIQQNAAPDQKVKTVEQATAPTQPVTVEHAAAQSQKPIIVEQPTAPNQRTITIQSSTAPTQPVTMQQHTAQQSTISVKKMIAPNDKPTTAKQPTAQSQKPTTSKHPSASNQKAIQKSSTAASASTTTKTSTAKKPTVPTRKAIVQQSSKTVLNPLKKPSPPKITAVLTDSNSVTYKIVRRATLRPLYKGPPAKSILKRKPGDIFPITDAPLQQDVRFPSERARSVRSPSRRDYERWRELRRGSADYCSTSSESDSDDWETSSGSSDESDVEMREEQEKSEAIIHPLEPTPAADALPVKEAARHKPKRTRSSLTSQAELLATKEPVAEDSSPDPDSPDAPSTGTSTAVASGSRESTASTTVNQPAATRDSDEDNEEESHRKHTALIAEFEAMYEKRLDSEWRWKTLPDPTPRPPSKSALTQALALACRNALANNAQRPPPAVVTTRPVVHIPTMMPTPSPSLPMTTVTTTPAAPTPAPAPRPVAKVVLAPPHVKTAGRQARPAPTPHPLNVAAPPATLHSPPALSPQAPSTVTRHQSTVVADPAPTDKAAKKRRRPTSRSPSPNNNTSSSSPDLAAEISQRGLYPVDRRKMITKQVTPAVKPGTGILRTSGGKRTTDNSKDETGTHVRCNLCSEWFAKAVKPKIRYHVLNHCPMKGFQCKYCNYAHHEQGKIKRHQKNVHNRDEDGHTFKNELIHAAYDVYMKRCFPNFDTGKLDIGKTINYPTSLDVLSKCMVCKKRVYNCLTAYHVVDKHINTKMYPCSLRGCKYKTISKRALVIHRQACHNDNSMQIIATRIDFTDTSRFTMKSFFPELNDVDSEQTEPELKRMAEAATREFNKDHELRPLLAAQDGLSHTLNEPLQQPVACVSCAENGLRTLFHNVYDVVLHTKSHIGGDQQWACPDRQCKFSSRYKIDVDMHCFDHHPKNNYQAVNRWHESQPAMMCTYLKCFPGITTPWPVSTIRLDHRSVIVPAHIGAAIKAADMSDTEEHPANLSEDEWSDEGPRQERRPGVREEDADEIDIVG